MFFDRALSRILEPAFRVQFGGLFHYASFFKKKTFPGKDR
jgi:hypothetical protein